eukprot:71074-Pelagomonas_calceolata.AAC.1
MGLEDAKTFGTDIYALTVDSTAFNTTDHDRMLWIMYDLSFLTDAIDAVKHLYESATTQVRLPSGRGRGYKHGCIPGQNAIDTHLANVLSSAAFPDDLLCPTSTIQDLK